MITVRGREWAILCDLITPSEQREIEKTIFSMAMKPRAIAFNEEALEPELRDKVRRLLDIRT